MHCLQFFNLKSLRLIYRCYDFFWTGIYHVSYWFSFRRFLKVKYIFRFAQHSRVSVCTFCIGIENNCYHITTLVYFVLTEVGKKWKKFNCAWQTQLKSWTRQIANQTLIVCVCNPRNDQRWPIEPHQCSAPLSLSLFLAVPFFFKMFWIDEFSNESRTNSDDWFNRITVHRSFWQQFIYHSCIWSFNRGNDVWPIIIW